MAHRVKKIGGSTAYARWLASVDDTNLVIAHDKVPRTPYYWSLTKPIYRDDKGRLVTCLETKHNHYEVWQADESECEQVEGQLRLEPVNA